MLVTLRVGLGDTREGILLYRRSPGSFLRGGRKPEDAEKFHTDSWGTCMETWAQAQIRDPGTLRLWVKQCFSNNSLWLCWVIFLTAISQWMHMARLQKPGYNSESACKQQAPLKLVWPSHNPYSPFFMGWVWFKGSKHGCHLVVWTLYIVNYTSMEYKHSSGRSEPQVDSHGASLFVYPIGIQGSLYSARPRGMFS